MIPNSVSEGAADADEFSHAAGHLDLDNRGAPAPDYFPFGCE